MMKAFLILVPFALAFSGCASSPLDQTSQYPSTGQVVMLGATTAGGAALGNQVNARYGAPLGAAVGVGAGLLANKLITDQEHQAYAEGYEQGRRDARVEVMRQYWYEKTTSLTDGGRNPRPTALEVAETSYNGGVVEGVRYTPRSTTQPTLSEPIRP